MFEKVFPHLSWSVDADGAFAIANDGFMDHYGVHVSGVVFAIRVQRGPVSRGGVRLVRTPADVSVAVDLACVQDVKNAIIPFAGGKAAFCCLGDSVTPLEAFTAFARLFCKRAPRIRAVGKKVPCGFFGPDVGTGTPEFFDAANEIAVDFGHPRLMTGAYNHLATRITARGALEMYAPWMERRGVRWSDGPSFMVGSPYGDVAGGLLLNSAITVTAAYDGRKLITIPATETAQAYLREKVLRREDWNTGDCRHGIRFEPVTEWNRQHLLAEQMRGDYLSLAFCGIGCYIAPDAAPAVKAPVVFSPANLAYGQEVAVTLARAGKIVYPDCVQNAAGVALSSWEVRHALEKRTNLTFAETAVLEQFRSMGECFASGANPCQAGISAFEEWRLAKQELPQDDLLAAIEAFDALNI